LSTALHRQQHALRLVWFANGQPLKQLVSGKAPIQSIEGISRFGEDGRLAEN
jgi:hypothetical protein